jgi:hemerythrin-like domain-containing protein
MLRDRALVPLSQQHHNGLALCVLTERGLTPGASPEVLERLAARAVYRFDEEISNHFSIEEEVVFPAVEQELGPSPMIQELVAEHRQIENLIDQLRSEPNAELLRQFTTLLRSHIRREENELFEDIQKRLSRKTLDTLGAIIDARAVRIPL